MLEALTGTGFVMFFSIAALIVTMVKMALSEWRKPRLSEHLLRQKVPLYTRMINRSWICSSSYTTSKISSTCVPHMTPVSNSFSAFIQTRGWKHQVDHLHVRQKTCQKHQLELDLQQQLHDVGDLQYMCTTHDAGYKVCCTCHENPTLRFWSRRPAAQTQQKSYKVLHLRRKSNLTILKSWPCHAKKNLNVTK